MLYVADRLKNDCRKESGSFSKLLTYRTFTMTVGSGIMICWSYLGLWLAGDLILRLLLYPKVTLACGAMKLPWVCLYFWAV